MQWPPTRPGSKSMKFHLVRADREHVPDRNAEPGNDLGDLVDEGDVDVPLRILDRLGGLGHLDRPRLERPAGGDGAIDSGKLGGDLGVFAGDHLGDLVDAVLGIAGVDPLGAVAEPETGPAG